MSNPNVPVSDPVPEHIRQIHEDAEGVERDGYFVGFMVVTAELAALWLEHNVRNRRFNPATAARYIRDRLAGLWPFTGESVAFGVDGALQDGQHRLTMVVKTGIPTLMVVVTGCPPEALHARDQGRKRTAGDMFSIDDKDHAKLLAAVTRLAVAYETGTITSSISTPGQVSTLAIRTAEDADPTLAIATRLATQVIGDLPATGSAIGLAAWLMIGRDREQAAHFLISCAQLRTEGPGDPRMTLLKRLQNAHLGREKLSTTTQAFYIVTAWNAWRRGEDLKILRHTGPGGPRPFPEAV